MNYANTILYKIQHDTDDRLTYIGNTTSFKQRKALHKRCCERGDTSSKLYAMIRENGGWSSFRMTPIKEYPCKSYHDAVMEEDRLRHEMNIPPYISKSTIDTPIIPLKQTVLKPEPSHTCYENVIKTVILEDTLNQPNTPQNFIIPTSPTLPTAIPDNTAIIPDNTSIIPTAIPDNTSIIPTAIPDNTAIIPTAIPDNTAIIPTAIPDNTSIIPTAIPDNTSIIPTAIPDNTSIIPTAVPDNTSIIPTAVPDNTSIIPTAVPDNTSIIPTDVMPDNTAIIPDNTFIIPTDVMPDDDVLPVLKLNKWKIKTIPIPDDTSLKKKVTYIEEERGLREQYLRNLLKKKSPNKKYKRNLTLKKGW